jgi:hypothetical protein
VCVKVFLLCHFDFLGFLQNKNRVSTRFVVVARLYGNFIIIQSLFSWDQWHYRQQPTI